MNPDAKGLAVKVPRSSCRPWGVPVPWEGRSAPAHERSCALEIFDLVALFQGDNGLFPVRPAAREPSHPFFLAPVADGVHVEHRHLEHFLDGFSKGEADACLAASVFHFGELKISEVKSFLQNAGISIRPVLSKSEF